MVQTLSFPSPRPPIELRRIASNAAVVVVHALAFAVLMLPTRWDPPAEPETTITIVEPVYRKPPAIPPTPPPPQPPTVVPVRPTAQTVAPRITIPDTPPADPVPVFDAGEIAAQPTDDVGPPVTTFDGEPQLAQLAYAENPAPRYPRRMIQDGAEGRVVLRVLVDATGKPIEVSIEESSGHRDLDRAAREQVLARWRFHPAQQAGVAVPAWALVPIDFRLP